MLSSRVQEPNANPRYLKSVLWTVAIAKYLKVNKYRMIEKKQHHSGFLK